MLLRLINTKSLSAVASHSHARVVNDGCAQGFSQSGWLMILTAGNATVNVMFAGLARAHDCILMRKSKCNRNLLSCGVCVLVFSACVYYTWSGVYSCIWCNVMWRVCFLFLGLLWTPFFPAGSDGKHAAEFQANLEALIREFENRGVLPLEL